MIETIISVALIFVAGFFYREGGRPVRHDWALIASIHRWYPDWNPGRRRKLPKFLLRAMTGLCVGLVAFWPDLFMAAACALLLGIGFTVPPGNAVGPAMHGTKPDFNHAEKWQVGPLKENTWASLVALGFLRGLPIMALAYFGYTQTAAIVLITSILAAPLAVWLAIRTGGGTLRDVNGGTAEWAAETIRSIGPDGIWARQEWFYGGLLVATFAALRVIQWVN